MGVNWPALSIAIVDPAGHFAIMQKSILRGAGVTKFSVADGLAMLTKDLIIGRDVVLLNWTRADDGFAEIIAGVRAKDTSPDPFAPIVMIAALSHKSRVKTALDAGANSFIAAPFRASDICRHVARAVAAPATFVDAPGYFGPERRRKADPLFEGEERRVREAKLLTGAELQAERTRMRTTALSALEIKVSLGA
ncbi:MAG: hypothetical protein AB7J28_02560 [Hyphomonadaceae bacterium]